MALLGQYAPCDCLLLNIAKDVPSKNLFDNCSILKIRPLNSIGHGQLFDH